MQVFQKIKGYRLRSVTAKNNMAVVKTQQNIPSGWQSIFVDDICYVMKGQGLSKKEIDPSGKNKCILYGELFTTYDEVIENVKNRTNSFEGIPSVNGDLLIPGSTTTVARDLAVASALNESGVLLGGDINILRKKDDSYDSNFLAYYLTHYKKDEIGKLGQGSTIVHLYGSNIKGLEVVIPKNIREQQKIAEILGTVDEDIAKTQEVIEATEKLKRGLMQQLFTRGIRNAKFKVSKLGDLCIFKTGKLNSNKAVEGGAYPFFTCSQETFAIDQYSFDQKAILLAGNNAAGKYSVKYYDGKFDAYQRTYVISIKNDNHLSYPYLKEVLNTRLNELRDSSVGSTTKFLTLKLLENLPISLPPISEQREIAEILSAVDEKISVNKKLKAKLTLLKKGLMQDLLSGKVRTNI